MSELRSADTVIILNPNSGSGEHSEAIRHHVKLQECAVTQTNRAGEAIWLAQEAAEAGASTIVAAGGDGTVNEIVQGIDLAGAFDDVTLAVLPVGTGNNFAKNIGITDLDSACEVLQHGTRRRIDIGNADGRLFVNSCVAGLTADSSSETSSEMKNRLGVLAYVLTTLRSLSEFESLRLTVDIDGGDSEVTSWEGDAICVLVGNGRRFTTAGSGQANMEDGLLDVTVIEDVSAIDFMGQAVVERLLGRDSPHVARMKTSSLTISIHQPESIRFSLDGEIVHKRRLFIRVQPRTLSVAVSDSYAPDPEKGPEA